MEDRFDYPTLLELLARLARSHRILRFADLATAAPEGRFVVLRHDVDYSPAAALRLAALEAEHGIRATYFVLPGGLYYSLLDAEHAALPRRLIELGHEVGLHYDLALLAALPAERGVEWIEAQADLVGRLAGHPVTAVAAHQPALHPPDALRGKTRFVDAYDRRFTEDMAYISDSCRAWRDHAWRALASGELPDRLQLALHPINWSERDRDRVAIFDRVHDELKERAERARVALQAAIARHSGVREHEARTAAAAAAGSPPGTVSRAAPAPAPASPLDWLARLWRRDAGDPLAALLPADGAALAGFYARLKEHVAATPRRRLGRIDPQAIVQGDIVAMGEGSVIEAGAVVHESCRLVLGAGSRVRAGAVLRDEVAIGDGCLVGVHCEVARSLLLSRTLLGHYVYVADSILGQDVNVAGYVGIANTTLGQGAVKLQAGAVRVDSGRTHLGALVGDGVRFGASSLVCPGCIVAPGLTLPPGVVLHGTIDRARRERLMRRFFAEWADG